MRRIGKRALCRIRRERVAALRASRPGLVFGVDARDLVAGLQRAVEAFTVAGAHVLEALAPLQGARLAAARREREGERVD